MRINKQWAILIVCVAIVGLAVWQAFPALISIYSHTSANARGKATPTTAIQHIVIIMMENHSFDNMFGRFPGVNGLSLPRASDPFTSDIDHSGPGEVAAIDGGKMDKFPLQGKVQYTQADIPNYWAYAQHFG